MQVVNVSGQLKWTLQGIFVAWTVCHCYTEIQYNKEKLQNGGILSIPRQGLILLKNLCPDNCSNGHYNKEGTIKFGGNILVPVMVILW